MKTMLIKSSLILAAAMIAAASGATYAITTNGPDNWTGATGDGNFDNSSNWSLGVPAALTDAAFALGTASTYTVTLGASEANNQLYIGNNNLTLTTGNSGSTYALMSTDPITGAAPSLVVGMSSTDTAAALTLATPSPNYPQYPIISMTAGSAVLGDQAGSSGALTVGSSGYTYLSSSSGDTLTLADSLTVGNFGTGTLSLNFGAVTIGGSLNIAAQAGSTGTVTIQTANAGGYPLPDNTIAVTGNIEVGGNDTGTSSTSGGTATLNIGDPNATSGFGPAGNAGISSDGNMVIFQGGTVNLNGGLLQASRISNNGGTFNYTSGNINLTDPAGILYLGTGTGQNLASSITLVNNQSLTDSGTVSLTTDGASTSSPASLIINGGTLSTGYLVVHASVNGPSPLDYISGTLAITTGNLNFGSLGVTGSPVLGFGDTISVSGLTSFASGNTLTINGGGTFSTGSLDTSARGALTYSGGTFNITNSSVTIGSGNVLNNLNLVAGDAISVSGITTLVASGGTSPLDINGGSFSTGSFAPSTVLPIYKSGTLNLTNSGLSLGINGSNDLFSSLNLVSGDTVSVSGITTIDPTGTLTINGGTFTTGSFAAGSLPVFTSGTLNLTNADLHIGPNGPLGASVSVGTGTTITVNKNTYMDSGGTLSVSGGSFTTAELINNGASPGAVTYTGGTLDITAGGLNIGTNDLLASAKINQFSAISVAGTTTMDTGGSITVNGGTFTSGGIVFTSGSGLTLSSGTVSIGTLTTTIADPVTYSGGGLAITTGNISIGTGSSDALSSAQLNSYLDNFTIGGTTTIDTGGSIALSNNGSFLTANMVINVGSAALTIDSGGSFSASGKTTLNAADAVAITGGAFSTGTLTTTASNSMSYSGGVIEITNGGLGIGSLGTDALASASLVNSSDAITASGTVTIESGGSVSLTAGTFKAGTLDVNTGSASLPAFSLNGGTVTVGTLSINATDPVAYVSGTLSITSGGLNIGGGAGDAMSLVTLSGFSDVLTVSGTTTLENGGAVSLQAGGAFTTGQLVVNTGTGVFYSGGAFNITAGGLGIGTLTPDAMTALTLNAAGDDVSVSGTTTLDTGGSVSLQSGGAFTTGQLVSTGGTISYTGGLLTITNGGLRIGNQSGDVLAPSTINGSDVISVSGTTMLDSSGAVTLNGGTLTTGQLTCSLGDLIYQSGTLNITGSNASLNIGTPRLTAPLFSPQLQSLTLGTNDVLSVAGTTYLDGSNAITLNSGGTFTTGRLVAFDQSASDFVFNGGALSITNSPVAIDTSPAYSFIGSALTLEASSAFAGSNESLSVTQQLYIGQYGTGSVVVNGGGTLTAGVINIGANAGSSGTLSLNALGRVYAPSNADPASGAIYVGGTAGGAGGTGTFNWSNQGYTYYSKLVVYSGGTVNVTGDITLPSYSITKVYAGGSFNVSDGAGGLGNLTVPNGSTLEGGHGTSPGINAINTNIYANVFALSGSIYKPGDPQSLTIIGNLTAESGSTLLLQIAGAGAGQYDQLVVDGVANIAGTLQLDFIDGFAPVTGDQFKFIQPAGAGSIINFSNVNITGLAPGFQYSTGFSNGVFTLAADNNATSTTPEPATLALLAIAGAGMLLLGKRRSRN